MTLFCKRYTTVVYWHGLGVFPASEGLEREMSRGSVVDGHPETPQVDHRTKVLAPLSPQNRTLVHVGILKLHNIKYCKCTNECTCRQNKHNNPRIYKVINSFRLSIALSPFVELSSK